MKPLLARLLLVAVLSALPLFAAAPAFAQEGGEGEAEEGHGSILDALGGPNWDSAKEVTIWSIAGVGVFATVLGVLYLFKRTVGGFPEHPTWVAPISIMRSSDLPQDTADSGHEDHMGQDAHSGHAPAH